MRIRFGLDIGIASVGWAVVDDEYNVLESGVNIFECAEAAANQDRRQQRQSRRLLRRRRTRIKDFNILWIKERGNLPNYPCNRQLELRVQGLANEITEDEIYFVLLNSLKHRGISYLDDAIDEITGNSSEYTKSLLHNQKELEEKYPCEIQYDRYQKYGKYRGQMKVIKDDNNIMQNNVFTTSAYNKELTQFLNVQKQYHTFLTEDFINQYMEIFNRKREYYVGPGNEKSRTDYGIYTTKIDPSTYEYITEENLFEKLIGKCSVYPDELRAAGATYTAQEFNLLNDLNNITVNGRKLSMEEKEKIISEIKTLDSINMRKIITKSIEEAIITLEGIRINKQGEELFHKLEQYNKLRKALQAIDIDITSYSREQLDIIGNVLTLNTDKESIVKSLEREKLYLDEHVIDCLVQLRKKNSSLFSKWQSFSLKIMKELIPELYKEPKNQMQLLTDMGVFKSKKERFRSYHSIPKELITEEIYNPVVKRSVNITIDVVNALIKKYGYPSEIVIEMPRDKNSKEQKDRIDKMQKENEKELKNIIDTIDKEYGIKINSLSFKQHHKLTLKLKLWKEQNGICVYSGKPIAINDLLDAPYLFEVDHIIPRSISFDDS